MVRNSAGDRESLLIRGMVPPLSSHLTYRWYPRSRGVYAAVLRALSWAVGSSPLARGLPGSRSCCRCRWRDHPRSRGVYPPGGATPSSGGGSSPLARGLRVLTARHDAPPGIIPARAGFTPLRRGEEFGAGDHPRSRGVYPGRPRAEAAARGSSPLARGLRAARRPARGRGGIIPARAGFTPAPTGPSCPCPDHPRSRGVYLDQAVDDLDGTGSSPLARGLRGPPEQQVPRDRIIPARAGFTPQRACRTLQRWDHPRSRGVYVNAFGTADAISGSSPLARGLLTVNWVTVMGSRIIPARAGFTGCASTTTTSDPDHPRSRGVYHDPLPGWACDAGSSPLARGLPAEGRCVPLRGRIIPARAGFTPGSTRTRRFSPDHPRSRGVYSLRRNHGVLPSGSSPLARGLRMCWRSR